MSDIEDVFDELIEESWKYADNVAKLYLHETTKKIAEVWANEIISMLTTRNLPDLTEATIRRRISRKQSILGPDYPLLETGEWITYIEFRMKQYDRHDELEVGVFDEATRIGHTNSVTPAYIAKISEYGDDLFIPARQPFSKSELIIQEKIDKIISESWRDVSSKIKESHFHFNFTYSSKSVIGRIVSTGSGFIFRWDS